MAKTDDTIVTWMLDQLRQEDDNITQAAQEVVDAEAHVERLKKYRKALFEAHEMLEEVATR